jgi:nucleoside-diphosphate-sugar epimerase
MGFDAHYYAILDISRARADFGYQPRFELVDGVRDYVESLHAIGHP